MDNAPALLTAAEVAQRFRVTRMTIYRWADSGRLPVVLTPGGQRRFRPEDVDAFMRPVEPDAAA